VHLGDWVEGITPKDRRFDIRTANPVEEQYDLAHDYFLPIADQGIAVLTGNHDEYIAKEYGDRVSRLARDLDVPYLGYSGFVVLKLDAGAARRSYIIYLHHGAGGGRKLGAKAIRMQELSAKFVADIYLVGHNHTYQSHVDRIVAVKSSGLRYPKITDGNRYYVAAPAYFDSYVPNNGTNYAERGQLYPQPTGKVRLIFRHWQEEGKHKWGVEIKPVLE
jgi:hypothetical protein